MASLRDRFTALVVEFAGTPGVSGPDPWGRGFGADALKVNGSIFAMVTRGHLVVKLPRERVDALISTGVGWPFDAGKGRPLKQWMVVGAEDHETWLALAREALDFVRSQRR
jgi:TfoX/Sxy family transcriptional regulator of competence genes